LPPLSSHPLHASLYLLRRGLLPLLLSAAWTSCQPGDAAVESAQVVEGVFHHKVHLVKGPWWIHVLEIDLPRVWERGIRLQTVNAPEGGAEKTSVMVGEALAGINGDFFGYQNGRARVAGLQIRDGCLLQRPHGRSAFAISRDGLPLIGVFDLEAGLITAAGETLPIAGFGHEPKSTELSFYNHFSPAFHDSVHAEIGFQLQGLEEGRAVNDTVSARVVQVRRRAWPLLLERNQWLVAAGAEYAHADRIAPGDTVHLFLRLLPSGSADPTRDRLIEAMGGGPRILRDGVVSVENAEERLGGSFAADRHPRTAIGYSQDGRSLFLVVVDGRQPGYSVGMSLEELASFMRTRLSRFTEARENAYQALNLDGGGSTTMVVRQQVVNSPSDQTGERPVANALLLVEQGGISR